MIEEACERNPVGKSYCDTDQLSFKAFLSRWMTVTTKLCPWTAPTIMPYIQASALAAAQSCSGGRDGVTCGNKWWVTGWDGLYGVGQQNQRSRGDPEQPCPELARAIVKGQWRYFQWERRSSHARWWYTARHFGRLTGRVLEF